MKKTLISVAAASLVMGTVASADVDVDLGGQAVVYYQTITTDASGAPDLFDQKGARANAGLQVNGTADLGNGFGAGTQVSAIGTLGLENNLVNAPMQRAGDTSNQDLDDSLNDWSFTKVYVTYGVGKTTLKLGRQELPKSLSPFAFSENWNVFKNTFDAALVINTDLPKTTLVGAYVSRANTTAPGASLGDMEKLAGGAYMVTAQTKLIPLTTLTGTYYHISSGSGTGADLAGTPPSDDFNINAGWLDAKVNLGEDVMGLYINAQGGTLTSDIPGADDTSAFGLEAGLKVGPVSLRAAASSVDDGDIGVKNVGTGVKTPLYTQMIFNQNYIYNDSDTFLIGAALGLGDAGKLIWNIESSDIGDRNAIIGDNELIESDLIWKVKAGEVNFLAAWVHQEYDKDLANGASNMDLLRFWARYNF